MKHELQIVDVEDVRGWYAEEGSLGAALRSIGKKSVDPEFLERAMGMPLHLRFAIQHLAQEGADVGANVLDSIPFYSLCKGFFLPLSGMSPEKVAHLFGVLVDPPPDAAAREELLAEFLKKEIGLGLDQKLGCVLGDPFLGRPSTFKRDSLLRLLLSVDLKSRRQALDRLTQVGDISVLFAEGRPRLREDPPLSAREVLETLRFLPDADSRADKFDILRSVLTRAGKLEAFFFAKLLLRKAGLGFDYQGPLIARTLAEQFKAPVEQVAHAMALTDAFHVAKVLAKDGAPGLRRIQLQPLVPVRPALAGGTTDDITGFPVWVERKYDGIRLMLHKSTDARGSMLCGAYTRNRGDWLELVAGLDATIKMLPARTVIIDGELYGTMLDGEGVRPASVYEVYAALQGERASSPVNMKFAAFDLVYLDGHDMTALPLSDRRARLQMLLQPIQSFPTPIPLSMSEGQLGGNKDDLNRLYHHFRAQGYEGIITKDLAGPYLLSARDPTWRKRKPEITLDLVLLGAVFAVTTKERAGMFGSYVIGARGEDGVFEDVGDVAGLDRVRDMEIQAEIMREGLITGRRIERPSSSGVRPGLELRPHIVVTVKFEGIAKDMTTGKLSLRDPKIAVIRSDKSAHETDSTDALQEIYLRARVG